MSNSFGRGQNDDDKFVDIHGRELSSVTYGDNEVAISLSDLKQIGFCIYQKSQFAKLSTSPEHLDGDFDNHMLEAAKTYMLENKVLFTQNQIIHCINDCKKTLGVKQLPNDNFFKNRSIAQKSDDEITIRVNNPSTSSSNASPHKPLGFRKMVSLKNLHFGQDFQSPSSQSFDNSLPVSNLRTPVEKKTQTVKPFLPHNKVELPNELQTSSFNFRSKQNSTNQQKPFNSFKKSPGSQVREKFKENPLYVPREENDVIVTYIEKPNCIWVRLKDNEELLKEIHTKVLKEVEFQNIAEKPYTMDKVYMAPTDGCWFRCKVVHYKPLSVLFLDYGTTMEVPEIRNVSLELSKLPFLASRITFKTSEYVPHLEDEIRIKNYIKNKDGTMYVNVLKVYSNSSSNSGNEEVAFFKRPPNFCKLENGQKVVIAYESDCVLYLRTRECFLKLKEIEENIDKFVDIAKQVENVKIDQLVLCKNNEIPGFSRAIVTNVYKEIVDVEFLDYFGKVKTMISELKTINEELATAPCTSFSGGKLENIPTDEVFNTIIQEHIRKRTKFVVSLGFDDELDLYDGTQLLSEQIQQQQKTATTTTNKPQHFTLKDIEPVKPEFGIKSYLCGTYKNQTDLALISTEKLEENIDYVLISTIEDDKKHNPVVGEVCYCFSDNEWYRCVVTRVLNDDFEVLLLDFGKVTVVKNEDIRKGNEHITKVPGLGLPCKLTGVPNVPNIDSILNTMIIEGEIYNADVKCVSDGKYLVELPSVYQQILNR